MDTEGPKLEPNPRDSAGFFSKLTFSWVIPLFLKSYKRPIEKEDLYHVQMGDGSSGLGDIVGNNWEKELQASKKAGRKPSYVRALIRSFGFSYLSVGILAFIEECVLRIYHPLLLNGIIRFYNKDPGVSQLSAYVSMCLIVVIAVLRIFIYHPYNFICRHMMLQLKTGTGVGQPLCLGGLIRYINNEPGFTESYLGALFALGITLGSVFYIMTHHPYFWGIQHCGMIIRIASCSLLYRKALRLSRTALGSTTIGQMVNLLSNDVNRFDTSVIFLHYLWIGPLQTIIVTIILWQDLGPSCLCGIVLLILYVPLQSWMGKVFSRLRLSTALRTDERIRIMSEIVNAMRVIKMYAWEKPFTAMVKESRRKEINVIMKTNYFRAFNMSMFYTSSKVIVFLSLLVYIITGNVLTAEKVFVTIALINNVRLTMTLFFPFGIAMGSETLISCRRIQAFLEMEEKEECCKVQKSNLRPKPQDCSVIVEGIYARWVPASGCDDLQNICLRVEAGELLAVVGSVGSGKSSLLHAILSELPIKDGSIQIRGKISYAAQEPWLFAGTVKDNILFGQPFNAKKYSEVIKVCALETDLEILPDGDETLVGERGVALSGGQKARVNLARAVYYEADIFLFDDPLSAVDTHVGKHLYEQCIKEYLSKKVRILVTHQLQHIKTANQIIVLENGLVEAQGTYHELMERGIDFATLITEEKKEEEPEEEEIDESLLVSRVTRFRRDSQAWFSTHGSNTSLKETGVEGNSLLDLTVVGMGAGAVVSLPDDTPDEESILKKTKRLEGAEVKTTGSVSSKIYTTYFLAGGGPFLLAILIFLSILVQVLYTGSDYWLSLWTNEEQRYSAATLRPFQENITLGIPPFRENSTLGIPPFRENSTLGIPPFQENSTLGIPPFRENSTLGIPPFQENSTLGISNDFERWEYVYVYSAMTVGVFLFSLGRTVLFFVLCMSASKTLHNRMFSSIIQVPIKFFDTHPIGQILNRFSKDLGQMDDLLPPTLFDFITIMLSFAGIIIIVAYINIWIVIPTLILGVLFCFVRIVYLSCARDIKRLEGITRSPVFTHLSSSLQGLTTIRALEVQDSFVKQFDDLQDTHSSTWFLFLATTRCFGIWLDGLASLYIAIVSFSFLGGDNLLGGDVGLAISSAMNLSGMFQWGVRQSAEVENQMTSVERVLEYSKLEPEMPPDTDKKSKSPDWPSAGKLSFINVSLKYNKYDPPVLKNVTFCIKAGQKIGIVGRTGAGKSSLLTCLFRLTPVEGIILIDDVDTETIRFDDLRQSISIIPQDPTLFTGTVRENLDPFGDHQDEAIWNALDEVQLKQAICEMPNALNGLVSEGGSNLSVGQRQLVCLARAILKHNKILVMDEATANVDPQTDAYIQQTIRTKFVDCTVLTIAHRLHTIVDSDKVLVMDAGQVKEYAEPYRLLENENSIFSDLVRQTGPATAEALKHIAKEAYLNGQETEIVETPSYNTLLQNKLDMWDRSHRESKDGYFNRAFRNDEGYQNYLNSRESRVSYSSNTSYKTSQSENSGEDESPQVRASTDPDDGSSVVKDTADKSCPLSAQVLVKCDSIDDSSFTRL